MKVICDLLIEYDTIEKSEKIQKSIEVDNFNFVKSLTEGKFFKAHIERESIPSLIHTLDDFFACMSVAEKVLDKN